MSVRDGSSVVCPVCSRDYELPRTHFVRADDLEYLPVPRLLGCLHTCCQSCLEEIWQKSHDEHLDYIMCPQCGYRHYIDHGVQYLPLDGIALSELIPLNGTNLSFCSRCHDEVPSYSWCKDCSITLCEFHHQDHKLSFDTSRHSIVTFKDISSLKIPIQPKMPPIICPQEMDQEATLYCKECSILISPKAMMSSHHKDHSSDEASNVVKDAIECIEKSMLALDERETGLVNAMKNINEKISLVKKEMADSMHDVEVIFSKIHEELENREHALLQRLDDIATRKTNILNTQLMEMDDAIEKCRHASSVAGDLLEKCSDSGVIGGGLYVVAAAGAIEKRREDLDDIIVNIPFDAQADPHIRASFVNEEVDTIHTILKSLGSLLTKDNIPAVDNLESRSPRAEDDDFDQDVLSSRVGCTFSKEINKYNKIVDKKGRVTYSAISKSSMKNVENDIAKINFTIRTEDPPRLSKLNKSSLPKEAVVVEVRVANNGNVASNSLDGKYGPVVGEVVFLTEVDQRYLKKHVIRSTYESFVGENCEIPVLRLTREIMSNV